MVEKYNNDVQTYEDYLLDVILNSEGAIDYQSIMTMPVNAIASLVKRMNKRAEDREAAMKRAR